MDVLIQTQHKDKLWLCDLGGGSGAISKLCILFETKLVTETNDADVFCNLILIRGSSAYAILCIVQSTAMQYMYRYEN